MANPVNFQLFVYGSLRRGFHSPAYEYISSFFTFVADAKVKGKLYDMGEYPAAIPTSDNIFITGELYTIKQENEFSWAIGQLDDYEGLNVEAGEEQLYCRELTEVYFNDQVTQAWIYWYNADVSGKPLIESGDIFQHMNQKK